MADLSNFQRSSPLRTPIRAGKLVKLQHKQKHLTTDVPPLARHLLRSLNNDRRHSPSPLVARVTIGQTVRRDSCLLEQSCLDQFDDSFVLEMDGVLPLTPRKSPHLLRRGSLTRLGKTNRQPASKVAGLSSIITGGIASSRKKFVGVRKRVMRLIPRRTTSQGYGKL
uniref:Uncharacterized protein n=1 Tax=Anopheles minimus TaxID=112268 RepID=A0A182WMX9_9DIPT